MQNATADKKRLFQYLKKHVNDEWYSKNYGGVLFPIFLQGYFAVVKANQQSPLAMAHGLAFQNWQTEREFDWRWNVDEMIETRSKIFEALEKNLNWGKQFLNDYLRAWCHFDLIAQKEEKIIYQNLSTEELVNRLLTLIEAAGQQGFGYVIDSLLSTSNDDWFKNQLNKYLGRELPNEELNILREPTHRSFVNEANLEILKIACLKSRGLKIDKHLQRLARKYVWIGVNYLQGEPKTEKEFLEEINKMTKPCQKSREEAQRITITRRRKQKLLKQVKAPKLAKAFVQMSDDFTFIQDCRKQQVLRLNFFIFAYLKELAKKLNFDFNLITYLMPFELKSLLKTPQKFIKTARERQKGCLFLTDKNSYEIFTKKELKDIDLSNFFQDYSSIKEAHGAPACPGKVRGVAKIILGSDQFANFKKGEILVTNQTTPDFVPLVKKASAIVAEQGGVTSHTAIVSRELGIPCVVGVKNAMKIFQSGQKIEVDAEKGIVKKI